MRFSVGEMMFAVVLVAASLGLWLEHSGFGKQHFELGLLRAAIIAALLSAALTVVCPSVARSAKLDPLKAALNRLWQRIGERPWRAFVIAIAIVGAIAVICLLFVPQVQQARE